MSFGGVSSGTRGFRNPVKTGENYWESERCLSLRKREREIVIFLSFPLRVLRVKIESYFYGRGEMADHITRCVYAAKSDKYSTFSSAIECFGPFARACLTMSKLLTFRNSIEK